jgi:hypothetical protein
VLERAHAHRRVRAAKDDHGAVADAAPVERVGVAEHEHVRLGSARQLPGIFEREPVEAVARQLLLEESANGRFRLGEEECGHGRDGSRAFSRPPDVLCRKSVTSRLHASYSDNARVDTVVLVEGISDRIALETLAARRGVEVDVIPMGGAHAIRRHLARHAGARVVGLCDEREQDVFLRAGMQRDAFHVCVADLEDELIRALGSERVETVLAEHGSLDAFRTFQNQPAWRGRPIDAQLRRFLRASDRRKLRYARLLVEAAVDDGRVPTPLDAVLEAAGLHDAVQEP